MKSYFYKPVSFLCAICFLFALIVPVFATNAIEDNIDSIHIPLVTSFGPEIYPTAFGQDEIALMDQFSTMTTSELNTYISSIANGTQNARIINTTIDPVSAAWMAAATIMNKEMLPCLSTSLVYALVGEDYSETDGVFATKIRATAAFQNWNPSTENSIAFPLSEVDLYFSLHAVNLAEAYSSAATGRVVHVWDTYDFFNKADFDNIIVNLISEAGWLLQQKGILNEYEIDIIITHA